MSSRRQFIRLAALSGAAALCTREALAQAPVLDEKDPQAVALGYVSDASRANKAKYASYAAGQTCSGCQLYQGKPGDAMGPCPIFANKQVAAKGWCSAFVKKA
jgi:High potential iron-sulfur protein